MLCTETSVMKWLICALMEIIIVKLEKKVLQIFWKKMTKYIRLFSSFIWSIKTVWREVAIWLWKRSSCCRETQKRHWIILSSKDLLNLVLFMNMFIIWKVPYWIILSSKDLLNSILFCMFIIWKVPYCSTHVQ